VLLFYGDPGTGKTATAEALAHELDRPLIVADYSKLENCFVGVTEKNVVRIFQEAQRRKAVLFWDEADAMLFDRDDAHRNWEVRHVNVILQQIERFEGVCILATNRRQKLDKALSRRISMQVEFRRPQTAAERLRIWNAMLPPQLPLDSGVDLGVIAQEDLSGGEIKNVLLNAARFAAARAEAHPKLTHADFEEAVRWETKARQEKREPVGFCRASLR
jgi:SpoVK/Ycf46/Vps4 family AAA+-type ATPase